MISTVVASTVIKRIHDTAIYSSELYNTGWVGRCYNTLEYPLVFLPFLRLQKLMDGTIYRKHERCDLNLVS